MLSKVVIKNFKSIVDLTLDLSFAEGKAPNGYKTSNIISFLESESSFKKRFVPIMNIYGANASGKSNIIQALFCFIKITQQGLKGLPRNFFSTNKIKKEGSETLIKLEFYLKDNKYEYSLAYNSFSINKEYLLLNDKKLFSINNTRSDFSELEIENYAEENIKKKFEITCLSSFKDKKIQINPFLSSVETDLPSLNDHLNLVSNFLKEDTVVAINNDIHADRAIDFLARSKDKKDINEAFLRISNFIKRLDIDIEKFKYEQVRDDLNKFKIKENEYQIPRIPNKSVTINKNDNIISINEIRSFHKNEEGEEVSFGLHEESIGTQLAFGLIGFILGVLDRGGVLIIDELDRSLHTLLLQSLIRVFKDKEYNRNNSQLICVLHNTDILDDNTYKMSEFSFVNKNLKRGSFVKRLSDFEGIRNDVNFRDRYLNGLYSGIPYPYN